MNATRCRRPVIPDQRSSQPRQGRARPAPQHGSEETSTGEPSNGEEEERSSAVRMPHQSWIVDHDAVPEQCGGPNCRSLFASEIRHAAIDRCQRHPARANPARAIAAASVIQAECRNPGTIWTQAEAILSRFRTRFRMDSRHRSAACQAQGPVRFPAALSAVRVLPRSCRHGRLRHVHRKPASAS